MGSGRSWFGCDTVAPCTSPELVSALAAVEARSEERRRLFLEELAAAGPPQAQPAAAAQTKKKKKQKKKEGKKGAAAQQPHCAEQDAESEVDDEPLADSAEAGEGTQPDVSASDAAAGAEREAGAADVDTEQQGEEWQQRQRQQQPVPVLVPRRLDAALQGGGGRLKPQAAVVRVVGWMGDWVCGCGARQLMRSTCRACGQGPVCR